MELIIKKIIEYLSKFVKVEKEEAVCKEDAGSAGHAADYVETTADTADIVTMVGGIEIFNEWIYGSLKDDDTSRGVDALKEWQHGE